MDSQATKYYLQLDGVGGWTVLPGLPGRWMEVLSARIFGSSVALTASLQTQGALDIYHLAVPQNKLQGQLASVKDGAVAELAYLDDAIIETYSQQGMAMDFTLNCLKIRPERGSLAYGAYA